MVAPPSHANPAEPIRASRTDAELIHGLLGGHGSLRGCAATCSANPPCRHHGTTGQRRIGQVHHRLQATGGGRGRVSTYVLRRGEGIHGTNGRDAVEAARINAIADIGRGSATEGCGGSTRKPDDEAAPAENLVHLPQLAPCRAVESRRPSDIHAWAITEAFRAVLELSVSYRSTSCQTACAGRGCPKAGGVRCPALGRAS